MDNRTTQLLDQFSIAKW